MELYVQAYALGRKPLTSMCLLIFTFVILIRACKIINEWEVLSLAYPNVGKKGHT